MEAYTINKHNEAYNKIFWWRERLKKGANIKLSFISFAGSNHGKKNGFVEEWC